MAFDFPNSPTVGQSYTPIAGTTYIWNGYGWDFQAIPAGPTGPAGGPTGPTGPSPGSTGPTGSTGPSVSFPSGSRVLLQIQTVSAAVATINFTVGIDSTYDEYVFELFGIRFAAEYNLALQVSFDAGASWRTDGAYHYGFYYGGYAGSGGWSQSTNVTSGIIAGGGAATAGNQPVNGTVRLWNPSMAGFNKGFMTDTIEWNSTLGLLRTNGSCGYYGANNAINGVRFLAYNSAGNITAGTIKLFGIVR